MKFRNGQSKKQPETKPSKSLSFSNQALLNQMYDRVRSKQVVEKDEFQSLKPLLSYLSISENSKVEQKPMSPHFDQNLVQKASSFIQGSNNNCSQIKLKKYSMQQRFKTDINEQDFLENGQLESLRQQNQILRQKMLKYQKRIITLESYESQVQYLKKLSFLQHNQIQKLRLMLKNIKFQKVQDIFDNLKRTYSKSKSLKEPKNDRNMIVFTENNGNLEAVGHKKSKPIVHKDGCKKDKENDYKDYRSYSTFFQPKSKSSHDKIMMKGLINQQKGSKLKNKKALAKLE